MNLEEIIKKMERLEKKGCNDEKLNEQYRKALNVCFYCHQTKGVHKLSCPTQKITITL